jgi:hypothetical protein
MFAPKDTREEARKQWPERADGGADDADVELDYGLGGRAGAVPEEVAGFGESIKGMQVENGCDACPNHAKRISNIAQRTGKRERITHAPPRLIIPIKTAF